MKGSSLQFTGALLAVLLTSSGCKLIDRIIGGIDFAERELVNVEDILNRAINDVNANAANWERDLKRALDALPAAERQVREDLEQLTQRAIAGAGVEARCNVSFMRDMLVSGLRTALAHFRREPPPAELAVVCNASPSVIDMNLDANRRNTVEVYGYNLDQSAVRLLHLTKAGQQDVTGQFALLSEFKRVINLGAGGISVLPESVKLRIDLGNGAASEIAVIQKWPEVCKTRDYNTPTGLVTVVPVRRGDGDAEFDGHGPCTRAVARVSISPNRSQLLGSVTAEMWECPDDMSRIRRDYSQAAGTRQEVLFTSDSTEEITELRSPNQATLEFIDTNHEIDTRQAGGALLKWNLLGDTDGDDIGKSYVTAMFSPAKVVLKKRVDCVTEEELARLMNQGAMSAEVQSFVQANAPAVGERAAGEAASFAARATLVKQLEADPAKQARIQKALEKLDQGKQLKLKRERETLNNLGGATPAPVVIDGPPHGPVGHGLIHGGPAGIPGGIGPGGVGPGTMVTPGPNK